MLFETLSFCEPLNQFILVSQRNMPGVRLRSSSSLRRKSVIRATRPQQGPVPATKDERPLWVR
jgi:hypothetical protein